MAYQNEFANFLPEFPAHYIAGEWYRGAAVREVLNPATEAVLAEVAEGSRRDGEKAVEAAAAAHKAWAKRGHAERADFIARVAALLEENAEAFARLVVSEQGKTIKEARGEVGMALTMLRYYAGFGHRRTGKLVAPNAQGRMTMLREEPYGVVAAIIPWNFPLAMFARKLAPALVAGNTIVIKPSEMTPLSALAMATLCERAEIPAGVVNVVTGSGAEVGDAMVRHPRSALITMTGSTRAGKQILAAAAEKVAPVSLELGGKAPFIVMADADLDKAADDAIASRMANCGQVCICNERTFVAREVFDDFVARLVERAGRLRPGDPQAEGSDLGPKVSAEERDKVLEHIATAKREGAEVVFGGEPLEGEGFDKGYWIAPTILSGLAPDASILREEVFGPVLPLVPFDDHAEVVAMANDSDYGLSAYVYTQSFKQAMRLVDELEYGEVYVNRIGPEEVNGFHCGWKFSGLGGDDGEQGYATYVRNKTVYLDYAD